MGPTLAEQYRSESTQSHGVLSLRVVVTRVGPSGHDVAAGAVASAGVEPTGNQVVVEVEKTSGPVQGESETLLMHWGVVLRQEDDHRVYVRPKDVLFPKNTEGRPGDPSVRTQFLKGKVRFSVGEEHVPAGIVFLVLVKAVGGFREQWLKNAGGGNFYVDLTTTLSDREKERRKEVIRREEERKIREEETLRRLQEEKATREKEQKARREADKVEYLKYIEGDERTKTFQKSVQKYEFGELSMLVLRSATDKTPEDNKGSKNKVDESAASSVPGDVVVVSTIAVDGSDLYLHWGMKQRGKSGWVVAPDFALPPHSKKMQDGKAAQTLLKSHGSNGLRVLRISNLPDTCLGIFAVLHAPNAPDHLKWISAAKGGDMYVPVIPAPPLPGLGPNDKMSEVTKEVLERIVEREMEYGSWTLMHRYGYANQLIQSVIGENEEDAWAAIYIWLRYSQIRVLTWQRNYNTKPRELSHVQLSLVTLLSSRYQSMPKFRWLIRLAMSCVGRGGSGDLGQRIRDDILVICRHGNWGHGSMMEQWHQKLHNNTNPDDVVICNALLAFWHSNGNLADYWNVMYSNGITRERLASYEQPITAEPDFPGHLKGTMISELTRYGDLLKAVHLGTDFSSIYGHCQGIMDGNTREKVDGFMSVREAGSSLVDLLRALPHARKALQDQIVFSQNLRDEGRRDLIFLDIALESEARRVTESLGSLGHDGTLWSHLMLVRAAAESLALSEKGLKTQEELERAARDIRFVIDRLGSYGESHDIGLRAAAGLTIIRTVLTDIIDRYNSTLGPLSKCLGMAFGTTKEIYSTFIEECVRGGPAFTLSTLLHKAEPSVRRVADLSPYSVIAPYDKEVKGPLIVYNKLRDSVGASVRRGTIIVAGHCDGDEDVPANTAFVIIGKAVDVLSHVSVRARNEHHGLVACLDADELDQLMSLHGCIVKVKLTGDDFKFEVVDDSGRMSPSGGITPIMRIGSGLLSPAGDDAILRRLRKSRSGFITPPSGLLTPRARLSRNPSYQRMLRSVASMGGRDLVRKLSENTLQAQQHRKQAIAERQMAAPWAIRPSEFNSELVGSKSLNLQKLAALGLPEWIHLPNSVAIPNGAMRKVLRFERNADLKREYERLLQDLSASKAAGIRLCPQIRDVIMMLKAPEGLNESLRGTLMELGCEDCEAVDEAFPQAWEALKGVWASLWNERAYLARRKLKLDIGDVDMAVLCQSIVPAEFAFVIHTTNPLTNDTNEIYAEAVIGLGETLVGNAPGQALGFTVRKNEDMDTCTPIIRSYPSKTTALKGGKYIFRSDSNAEDLEGFAGAGLHDSIPIEHQTEVDIDYSKERMMLDDEFRVRLMRGIAKVGKAVEDTMKAGPQDIEGCYANGRYYVVQARPQV